MSDRFQPGELAQVATASSKAGVAKGEVVTIIDGRGSEDDEVMIRTSRGTMGVIREEQLTKLR